MYNHNNRYKGFHNGIVPFLLSVVSGWRNIYAYVICCVILGDPGADSGGEGKSKRAEKYGTKNSKER